MFFGSENQSAASAAHVALHGKGAFTMLNDFDDLELREEPPRAYTSGKELALSYPHICPTTTVLPTGPC
jgi:hypothetical protein